VIQVSEVVAALLLLVPAVTLAVSAAQHLRDPLRFKAVLVAQQVIAYRYVGAAGRGTAVAEIVCAVGGGVAAASVVAGGGLMVLGLAQSVLLFTFAAYVVVLLRRGRSVPCGCFGSDKPASAGTALRAVLLGLAPVAAVVVTTL